MCGFCTESAAFRHLLDAMKGDREEQREPILYPIYLQECPLWRTGAQIVGKCGPSPRSLGGAMSTVVGASGGKEAQPLEEVLAANALTGLLKWLATWDYPQEWRWALCVDGDPPDLLPLKQAKAKGWTRTWKDG